MPTYSREPACMDLTADTAGELRRCSAAEAESLLASNVKAGLSEIEAADRLRKDGPNALPSGPGVSALTILVRQFQSSVVLLLVAAGGISVWAGDLLQAAGILVAVFVNAAVGFFTELRAKISLEALAALTGPSARVRRGNAERDVPGVELVAGDVVILEAGCRVPADLRLVDAASVSIDESAMTGESVPVFKSAEWLAGEELSSTFAYQGSLVLQGRAIGIVSATGARTELGRLGQLLSSTTTQRTPLEDKLETLGRQLSILTVVICAVLAVVGILHHEEIWAMLETSIALAVAAIPEGLPVVATLALAVGTHRMVKAKALVRQLSAVETLGCTTVICTDKTGTLTENQMVVTDLVLDARHFKVSGHGYEPVGEVTENGSPLPSLKSLDDRRLLDLLRAGALCNDARLESHGGAEGWHVHGDPTEGALIAAAAKVGLKHDRLLERFPRFAEVPFDLKRKRMSTLHETEDGQTVTFVKGSPESVLSVSSTFHTAGGPQMLTEEKRAWFLALNEQLAERGLRVLAVAMRRMAAGPVCITADTIETELELIGLIGMAYRPKHGVEDAVARCKRAGIRVVMVTGDQPATARAIAIQLGILDEGSEADSRGQVLSGADLDMLNGEELRDHLSRATVLARVNPEQKLAIVKALQGYGEIVAMTGDGINDAPALRQSDIGVAMGKEGTDLAREAANMVITDDNFATIVKAVEEGRIIYSNIQRSICYLLTASLASLVTIASAVLCDISLPLLPLQLLWLNLIMHIFPGLGIVLQRRGKGVMVRPPRDPKESLVAAREQTKIWIRSITVAASVLVAMVAEKALYPDSSHMTTIAFATLSAALLFQAWSWSGIGQRGHDGARRKAGRYMFVNMGVSYALMFAAIYVPGLQVVLQTHALSAAELLMIFTIAGASFVVSSLLDSAWTRRRSAVRETGKRLQDGELRGGG